MDKKEHLKMAEETIEEVTENLFDLKTSFSNLVAGILERIADLESSLYCARYFLKKGEPDEEQVNG